MSIPNLDMVSMVSTLLRSDELSCPSCVGKIEKSLRALPGVESATVRFSAGRIEVRHDPERASTDQLVEAVRRVGYEARPAAF
jgi:copper chaperone CopZ